MSTALVQSIQTFRPLLESATDINAPVEEDTPHFWF